MSTNSVKAARLKLIIALILLAVSLLCFGCVYRYQFDDCEARGGHMERIVGGRGGAVCEGATR